ncbi:hypothetical protein FHT86_000815 [Rhizobium sp. BK313]|uniref:ATP-binding protein n=1 Tax=Rhizobium sp. BK313 TaxID=2587081 RepID=UPI00105EFEBF|nr:ATP-binding protein [Rhizobium sp. BK313]MBB3452559.1 hypothetical protein [Rhizobium sp. BK313]
MREDVLPNITHEIRHMRIPVPKVEEAHKAIDRLREARRCALNDNRATPTEAGCVTLFGKSHAGKTTILNWYMETRFPGNRDPDRPNGPFPQRTAVFVTLNGESGRRSFLAQTLKAFGDPLPFNGSPDQMLDRIHNFIMRFKTELLVFDEANNLRMRKANDSDATRTHNSLRGFPKLAGCPIVIAGTEEGSERIKSDTQICSIDFPVVLESLKLSMPAEARILKEYCSRLGILLRDRGLFESRSNFVRENILACLVETTGGLPGRISRLVERAAFVARDEGASSVDFRHLEEATNLYAIPNKFIAYNPFTRDRQAREKAGRRA